MLILHKLKNLEKHKQKKSVINPFLRGYFYYDIVLHFSNTLYSVSCRWTHQGFPVYLVSLIFLKRSLVFPILLFSSISLHWSLRKAFLFLFAVLWNSAFKWVYLSFSLLLFASLLFSAISKASSNSHLAFLHFFFLGVVLIPASCTMSQTSVHSSSGWTSGSSQFTYCWSMWNIMEK